MARRQGATCAFAHERPTTLTGAAIRTSAAGDEFRDVEVYRGLALSQTSEPGLAYRLTQPCPWRDELGDPGLLDLRTGQCLDDPAVTIPTFPVRQFDGRVLVGAP